MSRQLLYEVSVDNSGQDNICIPVVSSCIHTPIEPW